MAYDRELHRIEGIARMIAHGWTPDAAADLVGRCGAPRGFDGPAVMFGGAGFYGFTCQCKKRTMATCRRDEDGRYDRHELYAIATGDLWPVYSTDKEADDIWHHLTYQCPIVIYNAS